MSATAPATTTATDGVEPILEIRDLKKHFPVKKGILNRVVGSVKAVDGLSFDVYPNETVGLVGESGCGKTTAGRSILRLIEPSDGAIYYKGTNIVDAAPAEMRSMRRHLQIIFQDPYSSLNPRMTIEEIIGEAIKFHGIETGDEAIRKMVQGLLERVGLQPSYVTRYPHEFSGGQRQRIGIARALALNPDFIVCDEAVSALDVSVQAQVINLLLDLQEEFNLSYLFIAHDLSVVQHISDRIAVMYLGQIMELAECDALFSNPLHPYTQALLSAIPQPNPRRKIDRVILEGDVPSPMNPPAGCRFHTRCPACYGPCSDVAPKTIEVAPGRQVKCHLYDPEYAPKDPAVWSRMPRLPLTDGSAKLPPGVAEVIRQIVPGSAVAQAAEEESAADLFPDAQPVDMSEPSQLGDETSDIGDSEDFNVLDADSSVDDNSEPVSDSEEAPSAAEDSESTDGDDGSDQKAEEESSQVEEETSDEEAKELE